MACHSSAAGRAQAGDEERTLLLRAGRQPRSCPLNTWSCWHWVHGQQRMLRLDELAHRQIMDTQKYGLQRRLCNDALSLLALFLQWQAWILPFAFQTCVVPWLPPAHLPLPWPHSSMLGAVLSAGRSYVASAAAALLVSSLIKHTAVQSAD